jgi:hypothetical protein
MENKESFVSITQNLKTEILELYILQLYQTHDNPV